MSFQFSLFAESEAEPLPEYELRRSRRTRRLSLSVHPSGRVEVLAPTRASERVITRFVREHADWIRTTQLSYRERFGEVDSGLPQTLAMTAIGHLAEVRYQRETDSQIRVRGGYTVTVRGDLDDEDACKRSLRRWVARFSKQPLRERLDLLAQETGLSYKRLQVRAQRSCWGSHSSTGTISLNYALVFLQPEQLRYVLIHELCHGVHMDHSKRFWRLVANYEPDYKRLDRSLDEAWQVLPGWLGMA